MDDLLESVLDQIELREQDRLAWGDTNTGLSLNEFEEICHEVGASHDPKEILAEMVLRVLIWNVPDEFGDEHPAGKIRSRGAQAVHLFKNLRQLFYNNKPITQSSTLVADYRYLRKPRQYPINDRLVSDLVLRLDDKFGSLVSLAVSSLADQYEFLSGFQVRATERVLERGLNPTSKKTAATIICAGTGSGKTSAFYIPSISAIVSSLSEDSECCVKTLAIYPRNELLKDQLNEVLGQVVKLNADINLSRGVTVGALFGDTPHIKDVVYEQNRNGYFAYDYLKCPKAERCVG